jgi:hypothetical protein
MDYLFVLESTQERKGKYHIKRSNKWAITTMNKCGTRSKNVGGYLKHEQIGVE